MISPVRSMALAVAAAACVVLGGCLSPFQSIDAPIIDVSSIVPPAARQAENAPPLFAVRFERFTDGRPNHRLIGYSQNYGTGSPVEIVAQGDIADAFEQTVRNELAAQGIRDGPSPLIMRGTVVKAQAGEGFFDKAEGGIKAEATVELSLFDRTTGAQLWTQTYSGTGLGRKAARGATGADALAGHRTALAAALADLSSRVAKDGGLVQFRNRFEAPPPAVAREAAVALAAMNAGPVDTRLFGRYHALLIGNDNYQSLPALTTAVKDAQAVAQTLRDLYGFDVRLVSNATRAEILRELLRYRETLTADDNLLVYYAGHGYVDQATGEGSWLPVGATAEDQTEWIFNADMRRILKGAKARQVLVIADSCFSGAVFRGIKTTGEPHSEAPTYYRKVATTASRRAISSGGLEPVMDSGLEGHSIFAYYLLKKLRDNQETFIDSARLFDRLKDAVTNNSEQRPNSGVIPDAGDEGGDFVFVRRK